MNEANQLLATMRMGMRQVDNSKRYKGVRAKAVYSRGMKNICFALNHAKQLASRLGRKRKKEKFLRKKYKLVTLTECFGDQFNILVKK